MVKLFTVVAVAFYSLLSSVLKTQFICIFTNIYYYFIFF